MTRPTLNSQGTNPSRPLVAAARLRVKRVREGKSDRKLNPEIIALAEYKGPYSPYERP